VTRRKQEREAKKRVLSVVTHQPVVRAVESRKDFRQSVSDLRRRR
jgi:hypothetical protein